MRELVGVLTLRYPKMFEDTGEQGNFMNLIFYSVENNCFLQKFWAMDWVDTVE